MISSATSTSASLPNAQSCEHRALGTALGAAVTQLQLRTHLALGMERATPALDCNSRLLLLPG